MGKGRRPRLRPGAAGRARLSSGCPGDVRSGNADRGSGHGPGWPTVARPGTSDAAGLSGTTFIHGARRACRAVGDPGPGKAKGPDVNWGLRPLGSVSDHPADRPSAPRAACRPALEITGPAYSFAAPSRAAWKISPKPSIFFAHDWDLHRKLRAEKPGPRSRFGDMGGQAALDARGCCAKQPGRRRGQRSSRLRLGPTWNGTDGPGGARWAHPAVCRTRVPGIFPGPLHARKTTLKGQSLPSPGAALASGPPPPRGPSRRSVRSSSGRKSPKVTMVWSRSPREDSATARDWRIWRCGNGDDRTGQIERFATVLP